MDNIIKNRIPKQQQYNHACVKQNKKKNIISQSFFFCHFFLEPLYFIYNC